jgi:hypothetical protein
MEGGTFTDQLNFDPVITQIITEEVTLPAEGVYLSSALYPLSNASLNRFLTVDGVVQQRLIVAPAQFQGTAYRCGLDRDDASLRFAGSAGVYGAVYGDRFHVAPNVWAVNATHGWPDLDFSVQVTDEENGIHRVLVLYRDITVGSWSSLST